MRLNYPYPAYVAQQIVTVRSPKACNVTPTLPFVIISTIITSHTPFCFSSPPPPACTRRGEIQFLSAVSGPQQQRPRNQRNGTIPRESNVVGKAWTSPRRRRRRAAEPAIVGRGDHRWKWAGRRCLFPGYLRAFRHGSLQRPNLVGGRATSAASAIHCWGRWLLAVPSGPQRWCRMERDDGGGGGLFFRGLQNRSHEKTKLRTRKSTLYLSPQKSTGRCGGEWGGVDAELGGDGGKSATLNEGSIYWEAGSWGGVVRQEIALRWKWDSRSPSLAGHCILHCFVPAFRSHVKWISMMWPSQVSEGVATLTQCSQSFVSTEGWFLEWNQVWPPATLLFPAGPSAFSLVSTPASGILICRSGFVDRFLIHSLYIACLVCAEGCYLRASSEYSFFCLRPQRGEKERTRFSDSRYSPVGRFVSERLKFTRGTTWCWMHQWKHLKCIPAFFDLNHSRILYDSPPSVMKIKTKINQWALIKLKSFCTTKKTISKVKRQHSEWEKITN